MVCALQRGQYFLNSIRSGCLRLFLVKAKLRELHSVQANVILTLTKAPPLMCSHSFPIFSSCWQDVSLRSWLTFPVMSPKN